MTEELLYPKIINCDVCNQEVNEIGSVTYIHRDRTKTKLCQTCYCNKDVYESLKCNSWCREAHSLCLRCKNIIHRGQTVRWRVGIETRTHGACIEQKST